MLKKSVRIAKSKDWRTLYKQGRTVFGQEIVLKILKNNTETSRFGVVVGTKVSKKATTRNRLRRQIMAIISQNLHHAKSGNDSIIIAKAGLAKKPFDEIKKTVERSFKRAGLIS
jgi:ribonuclease P protein component